MQAGEKTARAKAKSKSTKSESCRWKDCRKSHSKKLSYPDDGVLSRSSGFASVWVAANLEPWKRYGAGTNSFPTLAGYRAETPNASYAVSAASMKHPEYHTQKHHLISINLFKNVPKLKHDSKLVGYDVNAAPNGVCLPTYELDIVRHDLQAHRGSHPNNLYNARIQPLLKDLEKTAIKFCWSDRSGSLQAQSAVIAALNRISATTERRIKSWKWLLRSDALAERVRAHARLARLRKKSR